MSAFDRGRGVGRFPLADRAPLHHYTPLADDTVATDRPWTRPTMPGSLKRAFRGDPHRHRAAPVRGSARALAALVPLGSAKTFDL
jgi:hypothetical protein